MVKKWYKNGKLWHMMVRKVVKKWHMMVGKDNGVSFELKHGVSNDVEFKNGV